MTLYLYIRYEYGQPTGRAIAFRASSEEQAWSMFCEMTSTQPGDWRREAPAFAEARAS